MKSEYDEYVGAAWPLELIHHPRGLRTTLKIMYLTTLEASGVFSAQRQPNSDGESSLLLTEAMLVFFPQFPVVSLLPGSKKMG